MSRKEMLRNHPGWLLRLGLLASCLMGALCLGGEGLAQQPQLKPGEINREFSRVYIFVDRSNSLGHVHGVEGRLKSGTVMLNGAQPGSLVIDMPSCDADTAAGRAAFGLADDIDQGTRQKVNENMKGAEVLNVARFPEAKLENIKLTATGKTSQRRLPEYTLEGDFTLQQTTRKIMATCDLEEKNGWQHLRGLFKIRQTDYGIKPFSRVLGAVGVKDELLISGDLWIMPAK
ncbi:MAG: YceI family protein [Planctomycetota bacterium]